MARRRKQRYVAVPKSGDRKVAAPRVGIMVVNKTGSGAHGISGYQRNPKHRGKGVSYDSC